ncbi:MAG: JAB domain-containing protein [Holosporales bacterium]
MNALNKFKELLIKLSSDPYETLDSLFHDSGERLTENRLHDLINLYPDVRYVLFAPAQELSQIAKLTYKQSKILRMPHLAALRDAKQKLKGVSIDLDSTELREHSTLLIGYHPIELFVLYLLDSRNTYMTHFIHAVGWKANVRVITEKLLAESVVASARGVIFGHNHPSGNMEPSINDMKAHEELRNELMVHGLDLIGSLLVSKDSYETYQNIYVKEYVSVFS